MPRPYLPYCEYKLLSMVMRQSWKLRIFSSVHTWRTMAAESDRFISWMTGRLSNNWLNPVWRSDRGHTSLNWPKRASTQESYCSSLAYVVSRLEQLLQFRFLGQLMRWWSLYLRSWYAFTWLNLLVTNSTQIPNANRKYFEVIFFECRLLLFLLGRCLFVHTHHSTHTDSRENEYKIAIYIRI